MSGNNENINSSVEEINENQSTPVKVDFMSSDVQVVVNPTSERLQLLTPFEAWNGKNIMGAKLLIKALGKCTTDHI